MIRLEFIVDGPPVSQQTRNRSNLQAWKNKVRTEAQQKWTAAVLPKTDILKITVTYYYDGACLDVDNMVKPIQDSLKGLLYADDDQISDAIGRKRDLNGGFRVRGMSPVLAEGFCSGKDFLHISVEDAPDHAELA